MFVFDQEVQTAIKELPTINKDVPLLAECTKSVLDHVAANSNKIRELIAAIKEHGGDKLIINAICNISEIKYAEGVCSVVVYSNLPMQMTAIAKINKESINSLADVFKQNIEAFYNRGVPADVWTKNSSKLILKTTTITLEKWLATYTNASKVMKDSEIRDMAQRIKSKFLQYEIVICETPQDYWEMFQVQTGSCMVYGASNSHSNHGRWKEAFEKYHIHPASWYHYTLSSKGAYLRNKLTKQAVARCMLYQDAAGSFTLYGDLKRDYNCYDAFSQFQTMLEQQGFKQRQGYWRLEKKFRVPAYELGGEPCCPYPFADYVHYNFDIYYDETSQEFVFLPSANRPIEKYSCKGYITATALNNYNAGMGRTFKTMKKAA